MNVLAMVSCLEEIKTRGRYFDRGNANKRRDLEGQINVTQQPGFLKKYAVDGSD